MAKKESSFKNMVLVLFIVSAVASGILALVYNATKQTIDIAKRAKEQKAIAKVVPPFDEISDTLFLPVGKKDTLICYQTSKAGKVNGYAIKSFTKKGYSGTFWIMLGFTPDGKINNTVVLEHTETPGLGDKMQKSKSNWSEQFTGLNLAEMKDRDKDGILVEVKKDGGDIDAISAATISSRAFCDATERAYKGFKTIGGNSEAQAAAQKEKDLKVMHQVLPEFDKIIDTLRTPVNSEDTLLCLTVSKGEELVGYAIKSSTSKGYNGEIEIIVGILTNGKIHDALVLEHEETADLGDQIDRAKSEWSKQFSSLNVLNSEDTDKDGILVEIRKDGGNIDAISGATVSSRAFCDAVEKARKAFINVQKINRE
ncbi:MAG: hypothetical protein CSB06_02420 [Bacteroidia bacterium]|nr:MAG: hypothetical protein CSB06_02420 [Bacteroidia bacterium]